MCVYGIGLPFDHPIWQNLPPCRCGGLVNPALRVRLDFRPSPEPDPPAITTDGTGEGARWCPPAEHDFAPGADRWGNVLLYCRLCAAVRPFDAPSEPATTA